MSRPRVKCITTERKYLPKGVHDPSFTVGRFYDVIDPEVPVMGDDPWIRVSDGRQTYDRPRHMFGPILED